MKLISLTTIFLFFSVLIPAFAGPPILRENKKYTGPRIKESETPAGKFNKKITGLPPAEAVNLIKEYNSQHGKKFDSLTKKNQEKEQLFRNQGENEFISRDGISLLKKVWKKVLVKKLKKPKTKKKK